MKAKNQGVKEVQALSNPSLDVSSIRVSKRSLIFDDVWDFVEDLEHRPRSIGDSKLRVSWGGFEIHPLLRQELQRLFGLYAKAPKALTTGGVVKPNTLVAKINRSVSFVEHVISGFPMRDSARSLSQIEYIDLVKAARSFDGKSRDLVRQGLGIMFSARASAVIGKALRVTPQDLKNLKFPRIESPTLDDSPYCLSDPLFAFLSEESIARVSEFLSRLGESVEEETSINWIARHDVPGKDRFREVFETYKQWRRANKNSELSDTSASKLRSSLKRHGVRLGAMQEYLAEVNSAAQCVIALYVAPRFSEMASLQTGCLTERDGVPSIVGRVFKTKSDQCVWDDSWVTIAATRDAVRALECLAPIKNQTYLFSSMETCGGRSGAKGKISRTNGDSYTLTGYVNSLRIYLKQVDTENAFAGWKFGSHQFKHALARQFVRAKLGLPYISFHLKHLYNRISALPSDVTLGYGNASGLIQSEAGNFHLDQLRRMRAGQLFDPDSVIAGGGAKEFDERRKSYFRGMMAAGKTKEEILSDLARSDAPMMVNVGLAYCSGRRNDPKTGSTPPCIGSLRCNPVSCANAVIPKHKEPAWRRVRAENLARLEDPSFSYARAELKAAVAEANGVLDILGASP